MAVRRIIPAIQRCGATPDDFSAALPGLGGESEMEIFDPLTTGHEGWTVPRPGSGWQRRRHPLARASGDDVMR